MTEAAQRREDEPGLADARAYRARKNNARPGRA